MTTAPKSVLGTLSTLANRTIRGIRDSVPQGYFLGRVSKGDGPVELVSMGSLLASLKAAGVGGAVGANPTATAKDTAVNGTAATFMRSDGAPAVQKGDSTNFGIVKVDGTTITSAAGVITAVSSGGGGGSTVDLFAKPTASDFSTIVNGYASSPAPSATDETYGMLVSSGVGGGSSDKWWGACKSALSASSFTITAGIRPTYNLASNGYGIGLIVTDGTTIVGFTFDPGTAGRIWVLHGTSYTSVASSTNKSGALFANYMRIVVTGGSIYFYLSADGRNFALFYSETLTASGLGTITAYGFGGDGRSGSTDPLFITAYYFAETSP